MLAKKLVDPLDMDVMFQETETSANDERIQMLNALVKENYSTDNVAVKTDIDMRQIEAYSVGLLFAERFKNNLIRDLVNNFMTLSISKKRKSREEYTSIAKSMVGGYQEDVPTSNLKSRLLGD